MARTTIAIRGWWKPGRSHRRERAHERSAEESPRPYGVVQVGRVVAPHAKGVTSGRDRASRQAGWYRGSTSAPSLNMGWRRFLLPGCAACCRATLARETPGARRGRRRPMPMDDSPRQWRGREEGQERDHDGTWRRTFVRHHPTPSPRSRAWRAGWRCAPPSARAHRIVGLAASISLAMWRCAPPSARAHRHDRAIATAQPADTRSAGDGP